MKKGISALILGMIVVFAVAFTGCGGGSSESKIVEQAPNVPIIENATIELVQKEMPLSAGPYETIIINNFQASDEFRRDYADALNYFQISLLSDLKSKNLFKRVVEPGNVAPAGNALVVEGKILDMRIASAGARIWAGAMAGASHMVVYLKLTDAAMGNVIQEKIISSSNNAFAAAWSGGSNDQSLPMDMGKIISEYLATVIPAQR
ncbi:DUF4410 domain-containing protein [Desulfobacter vibrioformis]|uniref:DUF4410 domain-containing protein n=1 Tax=Desulfobacter vibrioformis TaxID=34031 RepID=UPI0005568DF8|nr:DUF4410 domain-containing protein [Desulfobacter vibrioformis]